jgi:hypothetical protein
MASFITAGNATNGMQVSSDNTGILELKSGTGSGTTAVSISTSQVVTGTAGNLMLISGTSVATTSGTAIDLSTTIPSWVKRITVMFSGVSTNGTARVCIQVGSGSYTTSGYLGAETQQTNAGTVTGANNGGAFLLDDATNAAAVRYGHCVLTNITGNTWVQSSVMARSDGISTNISGGSIALSGVLDRIRITTTNGTDTFDAGTANILYE